MVRLSPREALPRIYQAALKAVDPEAAVRRHLQALPNRLEGHRSVFLAGIGKAAVPMARAVETVLGRRLEAGRIIVKEGYGGQLSRTQVAEAGHPEPDERGREAALELVSFLKDTLTPQDLLIFVISGGGSALLPLPAKGLTLADKQQATAALLRCGATIQETNTIRKHLSLVKGGRLLDFTNGAQVLTLVLSDVVGDDLGSIASGPTAPDTSSFEDCLHIIKRYRLESQLSTPVLKHLIAGVKGEASARETPKPGDPRFERVTHRLVANNRQALEAAAEQARTLGYTPLILSSSITGDTAEVAAMHVAVAREIVEAQHPLPAPCCLISGGETTIKVIGDGQGGRNQEFVLQCVRRLRDWPQVPVLFASLGTDGTDGPTEAAGALATRETLHHAELAGLDPEDFLRRNDSYRFFHRLGDLIVTGPTQTNVMDLRLVLVGTLG